MTHNNPKWSFEENNNNLFFNFYAIASPNNLKTRHFKHVQKVWWIHTSCIQVLVLWFITYEPSYGTLLIVFSHPQDERFNRRCWVTFNNNVNIKDICWNLNNIRLKVVQNDLLFWYLLWCFLFRMLSSIQL